MTDTALNAGDTVWLLISTALVLLMTPALGFFYGAALDSSPPLQFFRVARALYLELFPNLRFCIVTTCRSIAA